MEQHEFNVLFKDLITHLYDYTVLETHPLTNVIAPPAGYAGSRGQYLRQLILDEIERFKPEGDESLHAIEWRPYHLLYQRYVAGASLRELSHRLSLSERQLRRDSNRAWRALAGRIWQKLVAGEHEGLTPEGSLDDQRAFDLNLAVLNLNEVITGIEGILQKRMETDGHSLVMKLAPDPILVMADRIILRQILISLAGYLLNFPCDQEVHLQTSREKAACTLFHAALTETWSQDEENDHTDLLESARYWSGQMNGEIVVVHPPDGGLGNIQLALKLPRAQQETILVVDDQKPTQQLFRRFLSRKAYQVIGATDPSEVVSLAKQLKPVLITLDVMMPKVDGWEILQALKTDPGTRDIPILVCSAWEEPELARSLGAAGFLKKPVRQRDLLGALDRLGL